MPKKVRKRKKSFRTKFKSKAKERRRTKCEKDRVMIVNMLC